MRRLVPRWSMTIATAIVAASVPACASQIIDEPTPQPPSPACQEALAHSDLAWIQERILTPSCAAFGACHKNASSSAAGLYLATGHSHAALVNRPSTLFPDYKLVVPGAPEQSYLMVSLGQFDGPLSPKGTMPPNNPLLCQEQLDAIERWITAGALP